MSDNHYQDPAQSNDNNPQRDSWEQEPFAPYDAPYMNPKGTGAPLKQEQPRRAAQPQGASQPQGGYGKPAKGPVYSAPQQVSKRTSAAKAEDTQPVARPRRKGRVARYHEPSAPGQPGTPPAAQPGMQPARQPGMQPAAQPGMLQPAAPPARRKIDPGERYSGVRTAIPQEGGTGGRQPARPEGRPRPAAPLPGQQRPAAMPPMQRPNVKRPRNDDYGWPQPGAQPPMQDPQDGRKPPRRGRGFLILLIVLIVLGGAFAGVWLPNWGGMDGSVAETMNSVKTSIKNLISGEEIIIRSFSVNPDTGTAPADLSFVILASSATETIRIIDDQGNVILEKMVTDQDRLLGDVTENSDGNNIWKLRYTFETAYTGSLTVQALDKEGLWDEEKQLSQAVSIEPAMVFEPPVQDFLCSTAADIVPVTVSFSVVTSLDVSAVRVVNDYGDEIAVMTINDAGLNMTETGETRVWTLMGTISEPYSGSLYVGYELIVGEGFTQSDFRTDVFYEAAAIPEATQVPALTAPPIAEPTASPTPEPTPIPTPEPTPSPTPEPTPTPSPTLLPLLSASADTSEDSGVISLNTTVYEGTSKTGDYSRTDLINMLDPDKYAIWDQSGVLTFRGGPLRQNAAYGTAEIEAGKMSVLWSAPMEGSVRMNSGVTLSGVGWPGQAAIVKWPMEVRQLLKISDEMKQTTALKEVIIGGQNGKLYFLDLSTGEYTRDPIDIKWPSNGAVSVNTDGSPIVSFGQYYSVKADKTKIDNGLHLFNLLSNKELTLVNGRTKPLQTNYSGVSGAPLFDKVSSAMVFGGQNGVLYIADFNTDFDYIAGALNISPKYHRYTWTAPSQDRKKTNIEGSVAMYGPYAYFGDASGVLQCVDVNTLTPVWAARTGDKIQGTTALEMNADGTGVALYVGNIIKNKTGGTAKAFRYDALTGEEIWMFESPDVSYISSAPVGFVASPVVGLNSVSDLVFFTATNGSTNSTMYALNKADGSVKWTATLAAPTESSPVAVYNKAGDAWIVQALADGQLLLMDASDGTVVDTMQLKGGVEASPAVYRDILVISTMGENPSYIYAIALE